MSHDLLPAAAAYRWPVRVYYQDTDAGLVVFHSTYLDFMERARIEWLRHAGFTMQGLAADPGILFVVRSLKIDYLRPGRLDDALEVTAEVAEMGRSRMAVSQFVMRGDEVLVHAVINLVCVDLQSFKPVGVPEAIRSQLQPNG